MDHKRDGGDYHKHQRRDGVEQETEVDGKVIGKLQPSEVEYGVLNSFAVLGNELRVEIIGERRVIRQHQTCAHAEATEPACELVAHLASCDAQKKEHEQGQAENQCGNCNIHMALKFHFVNSLNIDRFDRAENVDDNCNGERSLGRGDGDGEEREEHAFHLAGEEVAVEEHEVDVNGVEHQLERDKHGDHVFTGDESVDAAAEHDQRGDEPIDKSDIHIRSMFTGDNDTADYTCEQQHGYGLERQQVLALGCAHEGLADEVHVGVGMLGKGYKIHKTGHHGIACGAEHCQRGNKAECLRLRRKFFGVVTGL